MYYNWHTAPEQGSPEPKRTEVAVFNGEQYDGDWPPEDAAGFLAWFKAKIDSVAPEYRGSIKIELDSNSGWEDSHYAAIEITYWRDETPDEVATRIAQWKAACEREERQARAAYEKLRAKFEDSP